MIIALAAEGINAFARAEAPGVYVDCETAAGREVRKIGSLGLRVSRGCSYHGLALNVAMDLAPFERINPCGLIGMRMTQVSELAPQATLAGVERQLMAALQNQLDAEEPVTNEIQ